MQLTYFPYINLGKRDEVVFGNIRIWNFDLKKDKEVTDSTILDKVTRLIKSNVLRDKPLEGIGIVSIGKTDFRDFQPAERQTVDELRLLLFLAFISKNNVNATGPNAGHYVATSENFTYVTQNFDSSSNYISEKNGYLVSKLNGGYEIGELLFHMPPYVPEPMNFGLDEELIAELLKIKRKNVRIYQRILRATDLLFESLFNDPFVSLNARILLQVCSFEVLLNLPSDDQRKYFKEKINNYLVKNGEKSYLFNSERRGKLVSERAPRKVIWADKLYTLRNHIIHGARVRENEFYFRNSQHYIDIAPLFFVFLVKEIVNEKRRRKKKYFNDDVKWSKYEDSNGNQRSGFVYEDSTVRRWLSKKFTEELKRIKQP